MVESGVVTAFQSDEARRLTDALSRYASGSEGASGSKEASGLESSHSRGQMRPLPPIMDHRDLLSKICLLTMPCKMRPRVRSVLRHNSMRSPHRFLIIPVGGA